jgi:UPF0716 family protein affecting phage T7 exclusion
MARLPVIRFMRVYGSFGPWWTWALILALAALVGVGLAANAGRWRYALSRRGHSGVRKPRRFLLSGST